MSIPIDISLFWLHQSMFFCSIFRSNVPVDNIVHCIDEFCGIMSCDNNIYITLPNFVESTSRMDFLAFMNIFVFILISSGITFYNFFQYM